MNTTYSEKPIEIEGLKKFLELRKRFENCIYKSVEDYFKDKPKIIKCYTFDKNPSRWIVVTEDYHLHDINIIYEEGEFRIEIIECLSFEKGREQIVIDLCKQFENKRWVFKGIAEGK